jgi:hypothetical protein
MRYFRTAMPLESILRLHGKSTVEFPNSTIDYMNEKIEAVETLEEKLKIMNDILEEARIHFNFPPSILD